MDIPDLAKPIIFTAPPFGEVLVDAMHGGFHDWVAAGCRSRRWSSGPRFVRDLLREQTRSSPDRVALVIETIDALTDPELEKVALTFMEASGRLFAPRLIVEDLRGRRKLRRRKEGEEYDLEERDGESESERLLRVIKDWDQDHRDLRTLTIASAASTVGSLQSRIDDLTRSVSPLTRLAEQQGKIGSSLQTYAELSRRINEQVSAYRDISTTIERASSMSSAARIATSDIFGRDGVLERIRRSLPSQYLAASVRDTTRLSGVEDTTTSWPRSVNGIFRLQLPASQAQGVDVTRSLLIGSLGLKAASTAMSTLQPGFHLTAALGVEGLAARGLVADVLRLYSRASVEEAPAFTAALQAAHLLDKEGAEPEEAQALLAKAWNLIWPIIQNEADALKKIGLLNTLLPIILLCLALSDHTSDNVSELVVVSEEMKQELVGIRENEEARERHFRYVRDRSVLRMEPHAQALMIRYIYRDQLLRAIGEQGNWVKVEAFDYATDAPTIGWISRSRLRVTPN